MKIITTLLSVLIFGLISCNQSDKKEISAATQGLEFIKPPMNGVDVPYTEYLVVAAKGDTLLYNTGSIILFPPNAFIDKEGNIVEGNVQVKYREFTDPMDFYLAGIPMNYDSSGKQYSFESSGMCEVVAFKNGEQVFVNPKSKPEINLVSNNNSESHNLYFLDTVKKQWVNKGASDLVTLTNDKSQHSTAASPADASFLEPIKPEKANSNNPIIRIVIDPASFKELLVYDNLQFQLDNDDKSFDAKDASEEWSNVELQKGKTKGLYAIKFSNAKRTVTYTARPVLEGADYDKALKIFEKKNVEYQKNINKAFSKEKADKEKYLKDSAANEQLLEENKKIERLNILTEAINRRIEAQNALADKQNRVIKEANLSNKIIRSFQIDGFGIWNCDKAIELNCIPIIATFKDVKGNLLNLTNIAVLYKSFNGILKFPDKRIQVVRDAENMILGVYNGKFAYITYAEYSKLKINSETNEQTFIMTVVSEKENNYDYIKKIAGRY